MSNFLDKIKILSEKFSEAPWSLDIDTYKTTDGKISEDWTGRIYTGGEAPSLLTYEQTIIPQMKALCEIRNALPELLRLAEIGAEKEKENEND